MVDFPITFYIREVFGRLSPGAQRLGGGLTSGNETSLHSFSIISCGAGQSQVLLTTARHRPALSHSRVFVCFFFSAHRSSSLDVGLASHPRKQFIRENSDVRLTRQGSLTRLFNPRLARTMRSESNTSSIHSRFMSFTVIV